MTKLAIYVSKTDSPIGVELLPAFAYIKSQYFGVDFLNKYSLWADWRFLWLCIMHNALLNETTFTIDDSWYSYYGSALLEGIIKIDCAVIKPCCLLINNVDYLPISTLQTLCNVIMELGALLNNIHFALCLQKQTLAALTLDVNNYLLEEV